MSARTLLAPVACVAALAGLGIGAGMVQPRAGHAVALRAGSAPVDTVTLVCPSVTGTAAGLVTTMSVADIGAALPGGRSKLSIAAVPLPTISQPVPGSKPSPQPAAPQAFPLAPNPVASLVKKTPYAAVALTARGPGAAHMVADQVGLQSQGLGRGATDSPCLAPAGDWWFAGADGAVGFDGAVTLANPTNTLANIAVTALSAAGPLRLAGLDALTLPPRSVMVLKVASFAPNARNVAIHVHALSGSIVAALSYRVIYGIHPGGSDWIPPVAPQTSFVTAGLPSGDGSRHLILANPGSRDATVALRVLTRTGNFQPAGHQSVVVPAGRTADVDLSAALAGEPAAVVGTSDQPVLAEARMTAHVRAEYDDMAWIPASAPLSGPAGLAASTAPFNQGVYLVLAAPRAAVRVRIAVPGGASAVVTVPAGRTIQVDPRSLLHANSVGALAFVPLGTDPVYATRVLYAKGAHGPLITTEVPLVIPAPIVLPPVVEDPRAASR
ncbi:MAG: hypothetical protein JO079_08000 [Frankiaceae bacterium]|nr:hypothetical protein [Frankiaceae bacterium]MBV9369491.1 hypothetical protein [Frankiales bacterium]